MALFDGIVFPTNAAKNRVGNGYDTHALLCEVSDARAADGSDDIDRLEERAQKKIS